MKYLIAELGPLKFPVIFPDLITHSSVAQGIIQNGGKITSAGFFEKEDRRIITRDRSESLDLDPAPDDAGLIAAFIQMGDAWLLAAQAESFEVAQASCLPGPEASSLAAPNLQS